VKLSLSDRKLIECSREEKVELLDTVGLVADLATEARKSGLLALEDMVSQATEPFLKYAIIAVVDAMEPEIVVEHTDRYIICSKAIGQELLKLLMIQDGALNIQRGCHPRHVRESMLLFLGEMGHKLIFEDMKAYCPSIDYIKLCLQKYIESKKEMANVDLLNIPDDELSELLIILEPDDAVNLIMSMPEDRQQEMTRRMLDKNEVDLAQMYAIRDALDRQLIVHPGNVEKLQVSPKEIVANMFKTMPERSFKNLLNDIWREDSKLAEEISKQMFKWEDISKIRPEALASILKEIDDEHIVIALTKADSKITTAVMGVLSAERKRRIGSLNVESERRVYQNITDSQNIIINTGRRRQIIGDISLYH
jgi:hypothetical protein